MLNSSFIPARHSARRAQLSRDTSTYNAQECKKQLLAWAARATSVNNAVSHLDSWRESLRFVTLFKKYFPAQYAELAQNPNAWLLDSRTRIAPMESKFFELVDHHLFPISVDWMEMILQEIHNGDDIIPHIPLYSLLPRSDEWDSDAPEYDAIQVLLCFTWNNWLAPDEGEWQALHARFAERGASLPTPHWYPWRGQPFALGIETRLRDALMQCHQYVFFEMTRAAGYAWFQTAMQVLFRESGNALIDFDDEMMLETLDWTEENIEWLADGWKQGGKMMTTFWNGIHRMLEQPTICARLVELWNQAWACAPCAIAQVCA